MIITEDGLIILQPLKPDLPRVIIEEEEKKKAEKLPQKNKGKGKGKKAEEEEEEEKKKKEEVKVIIDEHLVRLTPLHTIPEYYESGGTKHEMFINLRSRIING